MNIAMTTKRNNRARTSNISSMVHGMSLERLANSRATRNSKGRAERTTMVVMYAPDSIQWVARGARNARALGSRALREMGQR
jgi:hypothetical protein